MGKQRPLLAAVLAVLAVLTLLALLAACRQQKLAPVSPLEDSEPSIPAAITPEEGAQVLEELLGSVDEATGNPMSYGYDGTVVLGDMEYYSYRVSWLVDGHMSYLTSYLVSTDGLTVQEAPSG